jgi:hypothetical protein
MSCDTARARFSELADGQLDAAERAGIEAHLRACPECRREWAAFERTLRLLHDLPRHRAPSGFAGRVLAAARPTPWPRRLARRLFVPLPIKLPLEAAAVLLVAVGALWLAERTPHVGLWARAPREAADAAREAPATGPVPPSQAPPRALLAEREADSPRLGESLGRGEGRPDGRRMAKTSREPADAAREAGAAGPPPAPAPRRALPAEREGDSPRPGESIGRPQVPAAAPAISSADPRSRPARIAPAALAGHLAVDDHDAAERALAELMMRVGVTEVTRAQAPGETVVEIQLPRARYPEFARGLAGIGRWVPESQPEARDLEVRLRVRVVRRSAH